jgi:CRP-like cAMP-binding protein
MSDNEVDFSVLLRPEVPTRNFSAGDTIFSEGDNADEFFVVVRGKVEIRNGSRSL